MKFDDYINKAKRCEDIEDTAKELAIALIKKLAGVDLSIPDTEFPKFSAEQKAACLMAASILHARLGAAFNTVPETLVGGFLMALKVAYPDIQVGMMEAPRQQEEDDAPGFLHFNKKPMVC